MIRPQSPLSRREFLFQSAMAAGALSIGASSLTAQTAAKGKYPIIAFSKPFQQLNAKETADFVAEVGWEGIECPVRPKGQIEPEKAPDELPKFVETFRKQKLDVYILTTAITSMQTPHTETVLRTASKLGIKRIRMGFWKYAKDKNPADQLKEVGAQLKDIAAACKDLGIQAGFQNHSGKDYVGAPVWDVFSIIKDLDPKHMGMCFDIGHATIEGGLSWPLEARLMEPFYTAVFVKDFFWKKDDKGVWKMTWAPLGEGLVSKNFFDTLKKSSYSGPISQHHEYEMGDMKEMMVHMKKDLQVLKQWLG
ncbi:MAG TPA: sugar phosphate isomerase/epimerase family protein [Verrucomicrobiae bacterium]